MKVYHVIFLFNLHIFTVHRWIAALYLYGYFFIVLIFCLVYFILTSKQIEEIHKAVDIYRVSYRNSQGFKGKFM